MAITEAKIRQWGNSLGMIIPSDIVKTEELREGDIVQIELTKEKRTDAFGILKGAPSFSKKDKGDSHF